MDQRLRRCNRLSARADFTRCHRYGRRLRTAYFTMYAYPRGEGAARLGLAVGKTVGGAVVRNRVKRRLRNLFRRQKDLIPEGYDVFVRAVAASASVSYPALEVVWREALTMLKAGEALGHTRATNV